MALKVTTFSSKGRATRIFSYKTNRIHHLQSDNQLNVFLLLEWNDNVINIEENVELNDLEENLDNIEELRLDKFTDKETGKIYQLHTNFLITILDENDEEEQIALSVKSVSELERNIVIEKMEIEKRYWKSKGIKFFVITNKEIDKQVINNIKWSREAGAGEATKRKGDKQTFKENQKLEELLYYFLQKNKNEILNKALKLFDFEKGLKEGTALYLFRYLIWNKEISIDMKSKINLNFKTEDIIKF
ncbi:MAG: TnsA endonuclease C-terminal domain-containing protein [Bacilli bacterium]|nr:TnsA endonuclease C-terminal domain-containing protein [Bacilli bacterium]